ncbi:MAG TPA: tetratricopeptide repeat protein [Bacteroidales bacterium]|nr:tetratricopeptide repeat protein [Bacteroidales bacterium]
MRGCSLKYHFFLWCWTTIFLIQYHTGYSQDVLLKEDYCERAMHLNQESEAQRNIDRRLALTKATEALQLAEHGSCDEMIALACRNIGIIHFFTGNYIEAGEYYEASLKLYQSLGNQHGEAAMLHTIGYLWQMQSEFDKALELYKESISIKEKIGDTKGMAATYDNISNIHYYTGQFASAIELINKTISIWEKAGELEEMAYSLTNLAAIYEIQGYYDEALNLLERAMAIVEDHRNDALKSTILHNMGAIYYELFEYEKAMGFYTDALLIKIDLDDKAGISLNLSNIGSLLRMMGRLDESNTYFTQALKIDQELGNQLGIATQLAQIAGNLLDRNEPLQAMEYYRQSNEIATSINARFLLMENYKNMITAGSQARNYGLAYEYMKKYVAYSEELSLSPEDFERHHPESQSRNRFTKVAGKISRLETIEILLLISIVLNLGLLIMAWRKH